MTTWVKCDECDKSILRSSYSCGWCGTANPLRVNKALTRAAPDLLAALKLFANAHQHPGTAALIQAHDAIARAEGKE